MDGTDDVAIGEDLEHQQQHGHEVQEVSEKLKDVHYY